ncbi:MAG TPA: DsbA family protein [Acidimicrobiales bacterium]|nr:DsbA family protein [Acidimicrobiales bacterium]
MTAFAVSWDYRCPFARNAHEHVVEGLRAGAGWDVTFVPFSLNQVHVAEGGADVWDDPAMAATLLPMQVGIAVRDRHPDRFLDVHEALFAARHDRALDIREEDVVRGVLEECDLDPGPVLADVREGGPLEAFRKEHEAAAGDHGVWGVPTFVAEGQAVFVRLMNRPRGDGRLAVETVERVLGLVTGWPGLNEFKHTTIPR